MSLLQWHIRADEIGSAKTVTFRAPEDALAALAEAIGVERVISCEAKLRVTPVGEAFDVEGTVGARIVQSCVVDLEPFEANISEPLSVHFAAGEATAQSPARNRAVEKDFRPLKMPAHVRDRRTGSTSLTMLHDTNRPVPVRPGKGRVEPEPSSAPDANSGDESSPGMADTPESIVDGRLDLGTVVQEFLALGVDPYPRKPGVSFEPVVEEATPSPFAALAKLRGGDDANN